MAAMEVDAEAPAPAPAPGAAPPFVDEQEAVYNGGVFVSGSVTTQEEEKKEDEEEEKDDDEEEEGAAPAPPPRRRREGHRQFGLWDALSEGIKCPLFGVVGTTYSSSPWNARSARALRKAVHDLGTADHPAMEESGDVVVDVLLGISILADWSENLEEGESYDAGRQPNDGFGGIGSGRTTPTVNVYPAARSAGGAQQRLVLYYSCA